MKLLYLSHACVKERAGWKTFTSEVQKRDVWIYCDLGHRYCTAWHVVLICCHNPFRSACFVALICWYLTLWAHAALWLETILPIVRPYLALWCNECIKSSNSGGLLYLLMPRQEQASCQIFRSRLNRRGLWKDCTVMSLIMIISLFEHIQRDHETAPVNHRPWDCMDVAIRQNYRAKGHT